MCVCVCVRVCACVCVCVFQFTVPSEPPPSYQDVISGKSPSIQVRSKHTPCLDMDQARNIPSSSPGVHRSGMGSVHPTSSPGVRRTQSASRPDSEWSCLQCEGPTTPGPDVVQCTVCGVCSVRTHTHVGLHAVQCSAVCAIKSS